MVTSNAWEGTFLALRQIQSHRPLWPSPHHRDVPASPLGSGSSLWPHLPHITWSNHITLLADPSTHLSSASGPLHLLTPLPGRLFHAVKSTSFQSLINCHLHSLTFPAYLLKKLPFFLPQQSSCPLYFSPQHLTLTWHGFEHPLSQPVY